MYTYSKYAYSSLYSYQLLIMKKILLLLLLVPSWVCSQNKNLIEETFRSQPISQFDDVALSKDYFAGQTIGITASFQTDSIGNVIDIWVEKRSEVFKPVIESIINNLPKLNPEEYIAKGNEMKYHLQMKFKLSTERELKKQRRSGRMNKIKYKYFYIKEYFPVKWIDLDLPDKSAETKEQTIPLTQACLNVKTEPEQRSCVNTEVNRHVRMKFDTRIAGELGLSPGVQEILMKFAISKTGEVVNIECEAAAEELVTEGIRIINLLPKFAKPATNDGKPVDVMFTIPLRIYVE